MAQFTTLTARLVPLPVDNIDTDQIIPARYLKTTEKSGLGSGLFADWRYRADGSPRPDFPLNDGRYAGAQILVAGDNFGCGSSREHAPWALADFGFRAVISTSFADIFRNNSLKNGLLPIILEPEAHAAILRIVADDPACQLTVDLPSQQVRMPDGSRASFPIDAFSKKCLLNGVDELGYLLGFQEQIASFEAIQR
jgi:3-isopropylmalate/(R)-2-methylmalate dehydratase small subunit